MSSVIDDSSASMASCRCRDDAICTGRRSLSNFSIDYILSPDGPGAGIFGTWRRGRRRRSFPKDQEEEEINECDRCGGNLRQPSASFDWLRCTRYRPPKLQRSRRKEGEGRRRRKSGRNPRIPFTGAQVAILEEKFRHGRYLSGSEVEQLSTLLCLSESRVKIWFQNRRARERRERDAEETDKDPRNSATIDRPTEGEEKSSYEKGKMLTSTIGTVEDEPTDSRYRHRHRDRTIERPPLCSDRKSTVINNNGCHNNRRITITCSSPSAFSPFNRNSVKMSN